MSLLVLGIPLGTLTGVVRLTHRGTGRQRGEIIIVGKTATVPKFFALQRGTVKEVALK